MATGFYATLRRETRQGTKTAWLLGPFETKEAAEARVTDAARAAEDHDHWCAWDARGVSSITHEGATLADLPAGRLNASLGL